MVEYKQTPEAEILALLSAVKDKLRTLTGQQHPIVNLTFDSASFLKLKDHCMNICGSGKPSGEEPATDEVIWNEIKLFNSDPPDYSEDMAVIYESDINLGYSIDPRGSQYYHGNKILRIERFEPSVYNDEQAGWNVYYGIRPRRSRVNEWNRSTSRHPIQDDAPTSQAGTNTLDAGVVQVAPSAYTRPTNINIPADRPPARNVDFFFRPWRAAPPTPSYQPQPGNYRPNDVAAARPVSRNIPILNLMDVARPIDAAGGVVFTDRGPAFPFTQNVVDDATVAMDIDDYELPSGGHPV